MRRQISLRIDPILQDAYDGIAAKRRRDRSDVLRDALYVYAHLHAVEGWNERGFAMSRHETVRSEVLRTLDNLRKGWMDRERRPNDALETAKMVQGLAAILVELWLLAREIETDTATYSEPGSPAATTMHDTIERLDALARPLVQRRARVGPRQYVVVEMK